MAIVFRDSLVIKLHGKVGNDRVRTLIHVLLFPFAVVQYFLRTLMTIIRKNKEKKDFAMVVIAKNEGNYIREFIQYHHLVGIDDFIIFDNESVDNTAEVIKSIDYCNIIYLRISGRKRQLDAYNTALNKFSNTYKYMIFLDVDEFIVSLNGNLLDEIKKHMHKNHVGGLALNWVLFGSSGLIDRNRNKEVIFSFLQRSKLSHYKNNHVKTICNTERIIAMINPHYGIYRSGYHACDPEGEWVDGALTVTPHNGKLRVNHYFTKSYNEFIEKLNRGKADTDEKRNLEEFSIHDLNDVYDDYMLKQRKNWMIHYSYN